MRVVEVGIRLGTVNGEPMVIALSDDDVVGFDTSLNDVPWDVGTSVYDSRVELTVSDAGAVQAVRCITEAPVASVISDWGVQAAEEDEEETAPA